MDMDVIEVYLDSINIEHTGLLDLSTGIVCTLNWHFPRENIKLLSTIVPLPNVKAPIAINFLEKDFSDQIQFKEQRRGRSFFSCEVTRIDDSGVFGRLISTLLNYAKKGLANPFIGKGMGVLLDELDIDAVKMITIAAGRADLPADYNDGNIQIRLKTTTALALSERYDDFGDVDLDAPDTIAANTANGSLTLRVQSLET